MAGEVHEVAARGFGAQAAAYDRARPSYPPDAVAWLAGNLRIGPGRLVVDLAAGTGKLTALLAGRGARLAAVEPVGPMGRRLRAALPGVPLVAAVAEALPLAAASVDAVVVAQAFHWFDAPRALAELARVVRPGGGLALIWNSLDRGVGWADEIAAVMDRVEAGVPWLVPGGQVPGSTEMTTAEAYLASARDTGWSPWTHATFRHEHVITREDVLERMRSVSHVAVLPAGEQEAVLGEISAILAAHEESAGETVAMPYSVRAMYASRLG